MPDNDLIKRCKRGDRQAFNRLVEEYQAQVINTAYGMLSNREDAYDAAQEVFIRVYKNINGFRGKSSFSTWIYRIVANVCSDTLRKRRRTISAVSLSESRDERGDTEIADTAPTPEESYELTEKQRLVRQAVAELKDEYRTVIVFCDFNGMSYDEISEILKLPVGTIKSRLNRARNQLKKNFIPKSGTFLKILRLIQCKG